MNYVFYKGVLHMEYKAPYNGLLPTYSWIYNSQQRAWYYQETAGMSTFVSTADVPAGLRTQLLLLDP